MMMGWRAPVGPARRGFTLIETLVVLAVVALLVALLVPAVQAARRSASRASCQNNLRQFGLAFHQYVGAQGVFPPGQLRGDFSRSAWVAILPGLEAQALFDAANFQVDPQDLANFTVEVGRPGVFVCPSDAGTAGLLDGGPNAYIGPAPAGGSWPVAATSYGLMFGTFIYPWEARPDPTYDPYGQINGCFNTLPAITPASITDGLAHTMLVAERATGFYNDNRISPLGRWTVAYGAQSLVYAWDGPNTIFRDWSKPRYATSAMGANLASSRHEGGVNVLLGDGSARFVRDSIDSWPIDPASGGPAGMIMWDDGFKNAPRLGVWQALATRAGGEISGEF